MGRLSTEVAALRQKQEEAATDDADHGAILLYNITTLQEELDKALASVRALEQTVEEERGEKKALAEDVLRVQDELHDLKVRSDEIRANLENRERRMAEQVENLKAELR